MRRLGRPLHAAGVRLLCAAQGAAHLGCEGCRRLRASGVPEACRTCRQDVGAALHRRRRHGEGRALRASQAGRRTGRGLRTLPGFGRRRVLRPVDRRDDGLPGGAGSPDALLQAEVGGRADGGAGLFRVCVRGLRRSRRWERVDGAARPSGGGCRCGRAGRRGQDRSGAGCAAASSAASSASRRRWWRVDERLALSAPR